MPIELVDTPQVAFCVQRLWHCIVVHFWSLIVAKRAWFQVKDWCQKEIWSNLLDELGGWQVEWVPVIGGSNIPNTINPQGLICLVACKKCFKVATTMGPNDLNSRQAQAFQKFFFNYGNMMVFHKPIEFYWFPTTSGQTKIIQNLFHVDSTKANKNM